MLSLSNFILLQHRLYLTTVGDTPELVVDRRTGFLVSPKDSRILMRKIVELLVDPDLRNKMGEAGEKRVRENFTLEKMVHEYEVLYKELKSSAMNKRGGLTLGGHCKRNVRDLRHTLT